MGESRSTRSSGYSEVKATTPNLWGKLFVKLVGYGSTGLDVKLLVFGAGKRPLCVIERHFSSERGISVEVQRISAWLDKLRGVLFQALFGLTRGRFLHFRGELGDLMTYLRRELLAAYYAKSPRDESETVYEESHGEESETVSPLWIAD